MPNRYKQISDEKGKALAIQEVDENDTPVGKPIPVSTSLDYAKGGGIEEVQTPQPDVSSNFNLRAFLEEEIPNIAASVAGEGTNWLLRNTPFLIRGPASVAASALTHSAAQNARVALPASISKYPPTEEPNIFDSLTYGVGDRLAGYTGDAIAGTYSAIKKSGGTKNLIMDKLAERYPTPKVQGKEMEEMIQFGDKFNAPLPTAFGIGKGRMRDLVAGSLAPRKITDTIDNIADANNRALQDILGGKVGIVKRSPYGTARVIQAQLRNGRRTAENLEHDAWNNLDIVKEMATYETTKLTKVDTGLVDTVGNKIIIDVKTPYKIKGPIDVGQAQSWAQVLDLEGGILKQSPKDIFPVSEAMESDISTVQSMIKEFTETAVDQKTGRVLVPYENVKKYRGALQRIRENLATSSNRGPIRGVANKLQAMLSEAQYKSVGDTSIGWPSDAGDYLVAANKATDFRVQTFSPKSIAKRITDQGKVSLPKTLETDVEKEIERVAGSRYQLERLVDAGVNPTDIAGIKIRDALNLATNPDGTLDGERWIKYFFDDNQSITNSSKLFNADQRNVIRLMGSYAKHGKFSNSTGIANWQDTKVQYGIFSSALGLVHGMVTGNIPRSMEMGLAFSAGIPMTRHFVETFMLDKEGAKLLRNRLYATSPQQASKLTKLMIKALPRGAQVYLTAPDGTKYTGETTSDGKVAIE